MIAGFATQRNYALNKVKTEWVLYLDADEVISEKLAIEIRKVVSLNYRCAYRLRRINIVFNKKMQYGEMAPDFVLRLMRVDSGLWEGIVHEKFNTNDIIKKLNNEILHYTYTSWEQYFDKFNKYTSLMAKRMKDEGKKTRAFDIVLRPFFSFIRAYILKCGFKDGKLGFIFAILNSVYTFTKYTKLYYIKDNNNG